MKLVILSAYFFSDIHCRYLNLNNEKYYLNLRMMFKLFLDSKYINFNDEQPLKFLMFYSK